MRYDVLQDVSCQPGRCISGLYPLKIHRKPLVDGKITTDPFSKDEMIGVVSLKLIDPEYLEASFYNHCDLPVEFDRELTLKNLYKAIKAFIQIHKLSTSQRAL